MKDVHVCMYMYTYIVHVCTILYILPSSWQRFSVYYLQTVLLIQTAPAACPISTMYSHPNPLNYTATYT